MNKSTAKVRLYIMGMLLLTSACGAQLEHLVSTGTPESLGSGSGTESALTQTTASGVLPVPFSTPRSLHPCHTAICMSSVPAATLQPLVEGQLFALLLNNGGCNLPCFLGIVPGRTSWAEANLILEPFVVQNPIGYEESPNDPMEKAYYAQIRTEASRDSAVAIVMDLQLDVDQGDLVQQIIARVELYGDGHSEFNDKHLLRYGLRDIFLRNGMPDEVYLTREPSGYRVDAVYDTLKAAVILSGNAEKNSQGSYTICPNMGDGQVESFELALANPSNSKDVKTLVGYPFYNIDSPIAQLTGLSIAELYSLIVDEKQPACFDVR